MKFTHKNLLIILFLFLHLNGFTGNPMAFSSIAQSLALKSGNLEVDQYAGNSNDLAYKNSHFYTGVRPSFSLFFLPATIVVTQISKLPLVSKAISSLDSLFISNPKLPPPLDPGKFIVINFLTIAFTTLSMVVLLVKFLPSRLLLPVLLLFLFTPLLNLTSSFYVQTLTTVGLTFLGAALISSLPERLILLSVFFLSIGDYTSLPLAGVVFLVWLVQKKYSGLKFIFTVSALLIIFIGFDAWFNFRVFGSPLATPYQFRHTNAYIHTQGFLGLEPVNFWPGLKYRLLSPQEGLVFYNPEIIVLSVIAVTLLVSQRFPNKTRWLALIIICWFWFISASFVDKVSGIPGDRYLLPLLPLVFLFTASRLRPVLDRIYQKTYFYQVFLAAATLRLFWNWHVAAVKGDINTSVWGYITRLFTAPPVFIFAKYLQTSLPNPTLVSIFGWVIAVYALISLVRILDGFVKSEI